MDTARNMTFLFYGFLAAWLALAAYLAALVSREGRIRRELDNLKRMIEDREPPGPQKPE